MDSPVSPRLLRVCHVIGVLAPLAFLGAIVGFVRDRSEIGIDFAVFHLGGRMVRETGFDGVYDRDLFREDLAAYVPGTDVENSLTYFISPPPWAWLFQPVSLVEYSIALAVWIGIGVVAAALTVRILDLPMSSLILIAASPAAVMNLALGQSGFFFLLLAALVHRAAASESKIAAGLLLGLFVVKPPLAIGWVLWWLLDVRRWYPALAASVVSAGLVALPTLGDGGAAWRSFVDVLTKRVEDEGSLRVNSLSFAEFIKLLAPGAPSAVTIVAWLAALVVGIGIMYLALRRIDSAEVLSGAAVLATLASSPHLSIYDTALLVIPVAVLAKKHALGAERLAVVWALYVSAVVFGPVVFELQLRSIGRGVGLEFPFLMLIVVLAYRWLADENAKPSERADSASVLANA